MRLTTLRNNPPVVIGLMSFNQWTLLGTKKTTPAIPSAPAIPVEIGSSEGALGGGGELATPPPFCVVIVPEVEVKVVEDDEVDVVEVLLPPTTLELLVVVVVTQFGKPGLKFPGLKLLVPCVGFKITLPDPDPAIPVTEIDHCTVICEGRVL